MSTQYQSGKDVPTEVLAARLNELADVVAQKRDRIGAEFTMRIPAECDRDADLVMSEAARRLSAVPAVQGEPVAWMTHHDEPMFFATAREASAYCDHDENPIPLYAAPQPAEQQPDDSAVVHIDKQCREDVAAALGFIRGGNYTWSYLLQQIKDTVSVAEQQPDITRLIEWDALRAECEKLGNLLCYAQPIIQAHAGASHELVEAINAAIRGYDHDNQ